VLRDRISHGVYPERSRMFEMTYWDFGWCEKRVTKVRDEILHCVQNDRIGG
jgi:hypothetical protein